MSYTATELAAGIAARALEVEAYRLGRHGHATQRPADSPADINGALGMGAPADMVESLYFDHYVRGYNDAYRETLEFWSTTADPGDYQDWGARSSV